MTQLEKEALTFCVLGCLATHDKPMTTKEIVKELNYTYSTQKVSAILMQLRNDGKVIVISKNHNNCYSTSTVSIEWITADEYFESLSIFQKIREIILDYLDELWYS